MRLRKQINAICGNDLDTGSKIKMKNIIGDIAEFEYRLWIGEQSY